MLKASNAAKTRIYETVILLLVLYACETWTIARARENNLEIREQTVERKIFEGVRIQSGQWRRQTSTEIKTMYGKPTIKLRPREICRWLKHIIRMSDNRMAKSLT